MVVAARSEQGVRLKGCSEGFFVLACWLEPRAERCFCQDCVPVGEGIDGHLNVLRHASQWPDVFVLDEVLQRGRGIQQRFLAADFAIDFAFLIFRH